MWKAFSRSVCEVVERRVGFTAFRSDVSSKHKPEAGNLKSSCRGGISNVIPQIKTYCPLKHLKTLRYKETSHEEGGQRSQQKKKSYAKGNDPQITACLGAMGWSTALVLGWYLSQPLGRRIFGDPHCRGTPFHVWPQYFDVGYIVHAQSPIQPLAIRPLASSSSIEEDGSTSNSFHSSFTSSSGEFDDVFTHQRGPFTPEEALDEASRVFEEASRALSGDVENRLGMVCMTKGEHTDALKHFRRASYHDNPVAAYNLGQCYELGLGTSRNLKKAAKWYKISSDRGHPTAMYNLAVFLANGWGGLPKDTNRALELLKLASNSGLKEATDALNNFEVTDYVVTSDDKDSTREFLEMIGAAPKRDLKQMGNSTFFHTQNHLSHLDWLDLSSSSSSSSSSQVNEDVAGKEEDISLYSGLCLEDHSKYSCDVEDIKILESQHLFIFHKRSRFSSGSESLDEVANCNTFQKPINSVA